MAEELEFEIVHYPDPVLRRVAEKVAAFDDELLGIVTAMYRRMSASKGVGLAAPQVGLRKRILVLNATGEPKDAIALVNPTLVDRSGPKTVFEEGCLSFPGIFAEIERPENCTVQAFTPEGQPLEETFGGFTSRIIQHEYDHLEGVLLSDRMSPAEKQRHKAALEEMVDRYKRAKKSAARAS